MKIRVGINGFGRIGRLVVRAAWGWPDLEFVHINDLKADATTAAHLLAFDSIHGRWNRAVMGEGDTISIADKKISFSSHAEPGMVPWAEKGVDLVLECSGKFRSIHTLDPYFEVESAKSSSPPLSKKGHSISSWGLMIISTVQMSIIC